MRPRSGAPLSILATTVVALMAVVGSARAQTTTDPTMPLSPSPGRNITSTGRTMPPANPAQIKASVAEEMAKAQKAADLRNKAWDARMRKTMGSICSGC